MPYNDPSSSTSVPFADLDGALLLFTVHEETGEIQTTFGPSTAIRADVAVLDGPDKGATYPDALVFPRKLQSQLRRSIGEMVLGRLGKGAGKPGQNPPYELRASSDADKAIADRYLAYRAEQQVTAEEPF